MTSISQQTGKEVKVQDVIPHLVHSFEKLFFKQLVPVTLDQVLLKDKSLLKELS